METRPHPATADGVIVDHEHEDRELAKAVTDATDAGIGRIIWKAVAERLGHEDIPGDVDPLASYQLGSAVEAVALQLIRNGQGR